MDIIDLLTEQERVLENKRSKLDNKQMACGGLKQAIRDMGFDDNQIQTAVMYTESIIQLDIRTNNVNEVVYHIGGNELVKDIQVDLAKNIDHYDFVVKVTLDVDYYSIAMNDYMRSMERQ